MKQAEFDTYNQNGKSKEPDLFEIYRRDIKRYPRLTDEELLALAPKARLGDQKAVNRIVEGNLPLVISLAKKYNLTHSRVNLLDLIAAGNVGLVSAARLFDENEGAKFSTFAAYHIYEEMDKLDRESSVVNVPKEDYGVLRKIVWRKKQLEQQLGREVYESDLLDISEEKWNMDLVHAVIGGMHCVPYDTSESENERYDDEKGYDDVVNGYENNDNSFTSDSTIVGQGFDAPQCHILNEDKARVRAWDRVLKDLPANESDVLKKIYGIGCKALSLEEISKEMGISIDRVQNLERKAKGHILKTGDSEIRKEMLKKANRDYWY